MRIKSILIVVALLLSLPSLAQDSEFPTLDALAQAEVPMFDYVDMVARMSDFDTEHLPPDSPPQYALGDREQFHFFYLGATAEVSLEMELRAQTPRVLIWVQHDADYPRWRAETLARRVETSVLDPVQELFQFSEPPGIDGDPRYTIALVTDPDDGFGGYFPASDVRTRKVDPHSNQREMVVVNLFRDDRYDFFDDILVDTLAHEYTHVLQHHVDPGEEEWLKEAMATYAGFQASKAILYRTAADMTADIFLETPSVGLTQWLAVDDTLPKYGAGFLFSMHLAQRFGDGIMTRLLADQANGWRSVINVLSEYTDASAEEVFADWVLANYLLDSRRGFGYRELDDVLTPPQPVARLGSSPATHEGVLPQFSTDYLAIDTSGADKLFLRLRQENEARLFELGPTDGDHVYYAIAADNGNSRLTRAFDLSDVRAAHLVFNIWYDLSQDGEYGFLSLSNDGGETWQNLRTTMTITPAIYKDYFQHGYYGRSRYWLRDRVNLSKYAPGQVMIRFEVVSNYATKYRGIALDELRIETIGFHDSFEESDDAWIAEGWIRTDNRLPNNTWLQVVQETGDGYEVSRALVSGSGDLTVDVLPGVSQALIAISPVVPGTSFPTEYELEAYLVDAEGGFMTVTRECKLTTTAGLNFRDAPDGNKIGLLPQGTAVWALDSSGDWYNVEYDGLNGWIHGGYVTQEGNCA